MYDVKKLNEYWAKKDAVKQRHLDNGWDGSKETAAGRDVTFGCGHILFVGWNIPNDECDGTCFGCSVVGVDFRRA